ncbi:hypothetical protein DL764_007456 [Monosporascus ibericus]|uniref:NADP-dependent oxidoreductase domain-containing protein n=1 Tax=Monosporascus ibericus TaxID=155417 RepID=A0A4Q4T0K3_9PEZI|nr:hypothetical protein DL764_007456 [Monosporascus ibericus]
MATLDYVEEAKLSIEQETKRYRHIDIAQCYGNERKAGEAGEAVESFGILRSAVFLTTEILGPGDSVEDD